MILMIQSLNVNTYCPHWSNKNELNLCHLTKTKMELVFFSQAIWKKIARLITLKQYVFIFLSCLMGKPMLQEDLISTISV